MTPLKSILIAAGGFALALCAAPVDGQQQPDPVEEESATDQASPPGPTPQAIGPGVSQADLMRIMAEQGGGTVTLSPRGQPRRRAPRFAPFGIGAGGRMPEQNLPRPGTTPNMMPGTMGSGMASSGQVGAGGTVNCGTQQLTDQQRADNRSEAQAMTDVLNRMAELATNMSMMQARQNGAQVTAMGAVPRVDASVTAAFERMLNCDEQRQAAEATERALAAPVGTAASWRSESRPGVSGSSTVTAVETAAADGSQCLTVTDVIIVDGAETRAPKRMCRIPPSTRYVRV